VKIRIKKTSRILKERDFSMSAKGQYNFLAYYKKYLDPESKDYLFKKKIIAYDLETKGLLPSPYIHQFAALEYDLDKEININDLTADNAFIAKCFYDYGDMKAQDKSFYNKRNRFYKDFSKNYKDNKTEFPYLINLITGALTYRPKGKNAVLPQMIISKANMPKLYGAMIFGFALIKPNIKKKKSKREKSELSVIADLNKDYYNFVSVTQDKFKDDQTWQQDSVIQEGLKKYFIDKSPESILKEIYTALSIGKSATYVRSQLRRNAASFSGFANFWDFCTRIKSNYAIKSSEDDYYSKYNTFSLIMAKIKSDIGMSYHENLEFTNYKTFPLKKYVNYNSDMADGETNKEFVDNYKKFINDPSFIKGKKSINQVRADTIVDRDSERYNTTLVSEKYALTKFLEWMEARSKEGDFLLMGQNIAAFDNAVIQNRAKFYGLQDKFITQFFDTRMFDTLSFFRSIFKPIMQFYEKVSKDVQQAETLSGTEYELMFSGNNNDFQDVANMKESLSNAKQKLDAMRKMYPNLRAKLDGLMVMFYGEAHTQTHTADDDCEQLLRVFLPAFKEVKNLISFYGDELYNVEQILKGVFGQNYEINLGVSVTQIPGQDETGRRKINLAAGETEKQSSKLKNDILVYAEVDNQQRKINLHGNKDFDTVFPNFSSIFGSSGVNVNDLIQPNDAQQFQNHRKFSLGLLDRLGILLKVVFKNYLLSQYDRQNYDEVFDIMNLKRTEAYELLKKISDEGYKLPKSKIPEMNYSFAEKYINKDFYAKHNKDQTQIQENTKKVKIKILKERKNEINNTKIKKINS